MLGHDLREMKFVKVNWLLLCWVVVPCGGTRGVADNLQRRGYPSAVSDHMLYSGPEVGCSSRVWLTALLTS
jgi:hypothetical protein